MFELLLTGPYIPFTLALALLAGLLALEVALALVGGSLLGADADTAAGAPDAPHLDADPGGLDGGDVDADAPGSSGPLAWLGPGDVPTTIWLAALLLGFGASGLVVQAVATAATAPLPGWLAAIPAAASGLLFARGFGRALARLVPRTESSAQTSRQLARRRGLVTMGTAARGRSAEVRVTDRHGNIHYLRAEPLHDDDVIAQGTEVVVLADRRGGGYRLIPLEEAQ